MMLIICLKKKKTTIAPLFPRVTVTRRAGEKTLCAFYGDGKFVVPLLPASVRQTALSHEQRGNECLENKFMQ